MWVMIAQVLMMLLLIEVKGAILNVCMMFCSFNMAQSLLQFLIKLFIASCAIGKIPLPNSEVALPTSEVVISSSSACCQKHETQVYCSIFQMQLNTIIFM